MSPEPRFTVWDLALFFGYEAFLYASGPLFVLGLLLLVIPAARRHALWRWSAFIVLAMAVVFALCAVPMLEEIWKEHEQHAAFEAATRHLTAPEVVDGIAFPAGSTVHVRDDGAVEFGTLPMPTLVQGVFLIRHFRIESAFGDGKPDIAEGTLARPAEISGIPCGPGELISQHETTRCVLDRDYMFTGHLLARGKAVEIFRSPLAEPPKLTFGTLARPELLFDIMWPSGTILGGISAPPRGLAHGPGPENQLVALCLPTSLQAAIPGATLHGFLAYEVQGDRRMVSPVCSILPQAVVGDDRYAQVGLDRFTWGDRADARASWDWTRPFEASAPR